MEQALLKKLNVTVCSDVEGQTTQMRVNAKGIKEHSLRVDLVVKFVSSYDIRSADFSNKKVAIYNVIEKDKNNEESKVVIYNELLSQRPTSYSKRVVFEYLKFNNSVLYINLQNNLIDDDEAVILSEVLMNNETLQHLNLKGNIIKLRGANAIKEAIIYNKALLHLDLHGNLIPIAGMLALGRGISKNKGLKRIDLRNKESSIPRIKSIVKASKQNSSIVEFLYL